MIKIIIGFLFILSGASGDYVLRGTNSSNGLIIVGFLIVFVGVLELINKEQKKIINSLFINE